MDTSKMPEWKLVEAIMGEVCDNTQRPGVSPPLLGLRGSARNRIAEAVYRGLKTWLLAHELAAMHDTQQQGPKCETCGGKKEVPGAEHGDLHEHGIIYDMVPCPDCQQGEKE